MRKVWSKWLAVAVFAVGSMATTVTHAQGSVSLQVFYDELQPYGTWIDHGRHGYVWMPNAGSDFVPYGTNGYWVQTSYGNTWVSNYNWGWAPFHYGRWFYDDFYGWLWVPDTTWGPAWVTWRSGGGYYGWAPLMPGLNVSMSVGYYNSIPHSYWNFVPYRYVMYRQVYRHCVSRPRVVNVINHTTVVVNNNYYGDDNRHNGRDRRNANGAYFTGPSRSEIESRNGERVPVYEVHDRTSPGQTDVSRNSVSLYKPAVDHNTRTRALPAEFTKDDEQGRELITDRRRQSQQREAGSYNEYRESMRRSGEVNQRESLEPARRGTDAVRSTDAVRTNDAGRGNDAVRGLDDLRRRAPSSEGRVPTRGGSEEFPGNTDRNNSLDQIRRDREYNNTQREREMTEQRRQQSDVQMRRRANDEDESRQYNEQRQRQMQQMQEHQPRQRSNEQNQRQAPSREPGQQSQQRTPSREPARQQVAPQQRQSGQPQMSAPQNRVRSGSVHQQSGSPSGGRTRTN